MQQLNGPMAIIGPLALTGPVSLPAASVGNTEIGASVAAPIDAEKIEQQVLQRYSTSGTAASATVPIHRAEGDGTIVALRCGSIAIAIGAATVTVDLQKNGTSVLTGATPLTLDSSNVARTLEDASIATAGYSEADFFELVIVATAGGGTLPTGLMIEFVCREKAE